MSGRKPSRKEISELIEAVTLGGWTVEPPTGNSNIFKAKCACGDHLEHIHSTPGKNYPKRKLAHMSKTCWKEANDDEQI
jgi:hypothetical protein